jgi:hypothetical protein
MACSSQERAPRKGVSLRFARLLLEPQQLAALIDPRAPQRHVGGQAQLLPRVRTHGVAEQRFIAPPSQPVVPAVLFVGPADRQLSGSRDLVVDNGAVAGGGPEHGVSAL